MTKQLALIGIGALALTGCRGMTCNLMYAPSQLTIGLDADDWADGEWEITVTGDGESFVCSATLPAMAEDPPVCDDLAAELQLDIDGISAIAISEFSPDEAEIIVVHDGVEILTTSVFPEYDVDEPNGPGCGERRLGTVTVEL